MNSEDKDSEHVYNFPDQELFEPEEETEPTVKDHIFKALRLIVVVVVLVGLINLSGVYQYFIYQRTPEAITQETPDALLDAEEIVIPLVVFIVRNDEILGSERQFSDVERLLSNADSIWEQATIDLEVVDTIELELSDSEVDMLLQGTLQHFSVIKEYDPNVINIFLVKSLHGINGLALGGVRSIFVADFTTVIDFRTLAHEIGHILGLGHVPGDRGRLMYRGANGFSMTIEEVIIAREKALRF